MKLRSRQDMGTLSWDPDPVPVLTELLSGDASWF